MSHCRGSRAKTRRRFLTVFARDRGLCVYCGVRTNKSDRQVVGFGPTGEQQFTLGPTYPTLDHVVPWAKSRDDSLENLVLACHSCNFIRGGYCERA